MAKRKKKVLPTRGKVKRVQQDAAVDKWTSGCTPLDCVLGGGWARGRIANIVGDKSTGKTLLAIEACVNFLRKYDNGRVVYVEAEAAFDATYAASLGLDLDRVQMVEDIDTVEGLQRLLEHLQAEDNNVPTLVVVDSLDALGDEAEKERDIAVAGWHLEKQKRLSTMFRKMTKVLSLRDVTVVIISQVRDNIGVTFGAKTKRSGGRALDFYCSQVIWLQHLGMVERTVKKVKRPVGVKIKAQCKKNKVGLPFRTAEFPIMFMYGIQDLDACITYLKSVHADGELPADVLKVNTQWHKVEGRTYRTALRTAAKRTRAVYRQVERDFLPAMKKYNSGKP